MWLGRRCVIQEENDFARVLEIKPKRLRDLGIETNRNGGPSVSEMSEERRGPRAGTRSTRNGDRGQELGSPLDPPCVGPPGCLWWFPAFLGPGTTPPGNLTTEPPHHAVKWEGGSGCPSHEARAPTRAKALPPPAVLTVRVLRRCVRVSLRRSPPLCGPPYPRVTVAVASRGIWAQSHGTRQTAGCSNPWAPQTTLGEDKEPGQHVTSRGLSQSPLLQVISVGI